jgi:hypothetical protein
MNILKETDVAYFKLLWRFGHGKIEGTIEDLRKDCRCPNNFESTTPRIHLALLHGNLLGEFFRILLVTRTCQSVCLPKRNIGIDRYSWNLTIRPATNSINMTVIQTSDVRAARNELKIGPITWAHGVMLLTYIWEVLGLKFVRDTDSHAVKVLWWFSFPPDKCSASTLN